jgi:hypothetical protein
MLSKGVPVIVSFYFNGNDFIMNGDFYRLLGDTDGRTVDISSDINGNYMQVEMDSSRVPGNGALKRYGVFKKEIAKA